MSQRRRTIPRVVSTLALVCLVLCTTKNDGDRCRCVAGVLFFWRESCTSYAMIFEVEGIQGAGPQILFGGGWLPKILHGDNPPLAPSLRVVFPPPIN
jgi:hypothetical protein